MESVVRFIGIALLAYLGYRFIWLLPISVPICEKDSLYHKAKRDLTYVGDYDTKMLTTLHYLFTEIYHKLKFTGISLNSAEKFLLDWNKRCNYDPKGKIEMSIRNHYKDVTQLFKDKPTAYMAGVDEIALPVPAATIRKSDYVDVKSLYKAYYTIVRKGSYDGSELDMV